MLIVQAQSTSGTGPATCLLVLVHEEVTITVELLVPHWSAVLAVHSESVSIVTDIL